jgi:ketosteroid isomerase-like protein
MSSTSEAAGRIALIKEYFRRGDAGDPAILDMFTDDVELRFPKFGQRSGKAAVAAFAQGLLGQLKSLKHYPDDYTYIADGDFVVAEGWETGELKDGSPWPVAGRSDGKFCNVFRFRGRLISHLHIYVDPDFTGDDAARFFWGAAPG